MGEDRWENYVDRKTGQSVGRFQTTVTDMYVDYARPQFMGDRSDVRWIALTDEDGSGLLVTSERPFIFGALHLTDEGMTGIRHPYEIELCKDVVLTLDAAHTGIGGGSCGPSCRPEYRISGPQHLRFLIRPLCKEFDPAKAASVRANLGGALTSKP